MGARAEPELTTTELAVLGFLARGPHTGYELRKVIGGSVAYFWAPAKSRIYAVLERLVARGFATSEAVPQQTRPDKQVHRITNAGRAALRAWLADPQVDPDTSRNPILLKLFFGEQADPSALVEMVDQRQGELRALLVELEEIERRIAGSERDFYGYLTLRWGLLRVRATLEWTDETLAALSARLAAEGRLGRP